MRVYLSGENTNGWSCFVDGFDGILNLLESSIRWKDSCSGVVAWHWFFLKFNTDVDNIYWSLMIIRLQFRLSLPLHLSYHAPIVVLHCHLPTSDDFPLIADPKGGLVVPPIFLPMWNENWMITSPACCWDFSSSFCLPAPLLSCRLSSSFFFCSSTFFLVWLGVSSALYSSFSLISSSFFNKALNWASTSETNSCFLASHFCLADVFSLGTYFLANSCNFLIYSRFFSLRASLSNISFITSFSLCYN